MSSPTQGIDLMKYAEGNSPGRSPGRDNGVKKTLSFKMREKAKVFQNLDESPTKMVNPESPKRTASFARREAAKAADVKAEEPGTREQALSPDRPLVANHYFQRDKEQAIAREAARVAAEAEAKLAAEKAAVAAAEAEIIAKEAVAKAAAEAKMKGRAQLKEAIAKKVVPPAEPSLIGGMFRFIMFVFGPAALVFYASMIGHEANQALEVFVKK